MQNQSFDTYKVIYDPYDLPADFPIEDCFRELITISPEPVTLMHFHNELEIGYCYEGCGLFFVDGRVMPFATGDVSIIFPEQVHVAQSDRSIPSHWDFMMINPFKLLCELSIADFKIISSLFSGDAIINNIIPKNHPSEIAETIGKIFQESGECKQNYKPMIKSLVWELMVQLSRVEYTKSQKASQNNNHDIVRIGPALNYISDNYTEEVKITDLAKVCSMSTAHFRRLFSSALGKTPSEYLYEVKIKMASMLLINSENSILDISMNVGYPTLSSFNRHFKRIMGISPREWRRERIGNDSLLMNKSLAKANKRQEML